MADLLEEKFEYYRQAFDAEHDKALTKQLGQDFWKLSKESDVRAKLRAMGISESFLSGDASYAAAEAAYAKFLTLPRYPRGFTRKELLRFNKRKQQRRARTGRR